MDTEIFHLGDNYFVNVNCYITILPQGNPKDQLIQCFMWVGETWLHPIRINGYPINVLIALNTYKMLYDGIDIVQLARNEMHDLLIRNREHLIELIREEEYWKHN